MKQYIICWESSHESHRKRQWQMVHPQILSAVKYGLTRGWSAEKIRREGRGWLNVSMQHFGSRLVHISEIFLSKNSCDFVSRLLRSYSFFSTLGNGI